MTHRKGLRINEKKKNFEYYLIVFLFTILIVVCFLQVLFRFVFNLPLAWTEELSRYVFIILIYCGASAAVLDNAHVRVELIDNVLSERGRFALDIAVKLLCAAVSLVIAYNSRQIIYNASLSKQLYSRSIEPRLYQGEYCHFSISN